MGIATVMVAAFELQSNLKLSFATLAEYDYIVGRLKHERRQTMNLTKTKGSKILLLKSDDAIVAWVGYNFEAYPGYPEIFSQTVLPSERGNHYGTILGYHVAKDIFSNGFEAAYFRMETGSSTTLRDHHLNYFCSIVPKQELPQDWLSMCGRCDLFEGECKERSFLKLDIPSFIQKIESKFFTPGTSLHI